MKKVHRNFKRKNEKKERTNVDRVSYKRKDKEIFIKNKRKIKIKKENRSALSEGHTPTDLPVKLRLFRGKLHPYTYTASYCSRFVKHNIVCVEYRDLSSD